MAFLNIAFVVSLGFLSFVSAAYVTIPASQKSTGEVFTLKNFTTTTGATGMVAIVHKPIGHFHIYYPVNASGDCDGLELTSVQSKTHNCAFATNGGPFSYHSPTCQGNIVSDGKIIQAGTGRGQSFGLTHANEWVLGDITAADIKQLGFKELTSGFDWLTNNGKIMPVAGGLIAPRTFAGINPAGELLLFVVNGYEKPPLGLTLQQAAHIALQWKCNYAINLDGGGSTVACANGKVISKPTCIDIPTICERKVTTITCVTP